MKIEGLAISSGIAIGKIFKLDKLVLKITKKKVNAKEAIKNLDVALNLAKKQINQLKAQAKDDLKKEILDVFDAHLEILEDVEFLKDIKNYIHENSCNAAYAAKIIGEKYQNLFQGLEDEYMQARAADIKDVAERIIQNLENSDKKVTKLKEESIIVAHDITPAEILLLDKSMIKGFVTETGNVTSHVAIVAQSLNIPAIIAKDCLSKVTNNKTVIIDGNKGILITDPSSQELKNAKEKIIEDNKEKEIINKFRKKTTLTQDNKKLELAANIANPSELDNVILNGAEGIGLFRTEFLFMDNNDWPSEEDQFLVYKKVLETMKDKKVVIRTLDIGGDKELKYFKFPKELNPFLGVRAIRLSFKYPEIFKTQLRALLRASIYGKLAIMFPMIALESEVMQAKKIFNEVKKELKEQKISFNPNIELGIMIEIPSAALLAEQLARHVDFFSIGTNDLLQYSMAADRINANLAYLYQPLNPAILKLINLIIEGAHKNNKWVGMCGAVACLEPAVPILVAMGIDELSMPAFQVPKIRKLISTLNKEELSKHIPAILSLSNEEEVKEHFKKLIKK